MAHASDGPVLRHFTSQRLPLAVHDWGNAGAPPLILLHGGRDHARNWDDVALRLRDRYHIHCPDLRGHGDSAWETDGLYAIDSYVLDLAVLVDTIGAAPLPIIAHSLGGQIAIRYTAAFPERVERLLAIEGLGPSPKMIAEREAIPPATRLRSWIDDARRVDARPPRQMADLAEAEARLAKANERLSPAQVAHLAAHAVRPHPDGGLQWKYDERLSVWSPGDFSTEEKHALWSAITCPTLLVYGGASWASNPVTDGRAAYMPAAEVIVIDGAGHWVQHERFEPFMDAVERFLS